MCFPLWFTIFYLACILVFGVLISIAMRKYRGRTDPQHYPSYMRNLPPSSTFTTNYAPSEIRPYSIFSRMISGLGNWLYPSAPYFNAAVIIIGVGSCGLGVFIWIQLAADVPSCLLVPIGGLGFQIGSFGLVLLGIYTENRHAKHGIVAGMAFGGYYLALFSWFYPIAFSAAFPSWVLVFHVLPWSLLGYHIYAVRGFNLHEQMQDLPIKPLGKNYNFSEWLLFGGICLWILSLFTSGILI